MARQRVGGDDLRGRERPPTNLKAAQSGDRRAALEVLRDTLAKALDECEPNMHAQIAGQYRATLTEIAALAPAEGKSKRDDLKERRAARSADRGAAPTAKRAASAGRDRKRRSGA